MISAMRYKQKRFYAWNNNVAYLAGLIASDGCLINDGRHVALTSKDLEIIVATQTILDKKHLKVGIKTGQFGTDAYQFQCADSRLLFTAMYSNRPAYKLTRKYEKFAGFITTDPYGKMARVKGEWWNPVDTHA